jgi:hypothetical protein
MHAAVEKGEIERERIDEHDTYDTIQYNTIPVTF